MSRAITVNLNDYESDAVASLAESKDLTEDQLMRQALRLYQKVENHLNKGDKVLVETENTPQTVLPLPQTGFVRLWQIIGCTKRGIIPLVPESKATWWSGVAKGTRPKPLKLGSNTTVWRAEDIHRFIRDGEWNTAEGGAQ